MKTKLRLMALLAAVVMLASVSTVVATHVTPTKEDGNPTCSDFAPDGVEWTEFKVEGEGDVESGEYSDGTLNVTIEVTDTDDGPIFDWESNIDVSAVVVKGGPNANLYEYAPAATSDTGLHSPLNDNNGKWYGLSHISFCYEEEPPEETCEDNPDQDKCLPPEETCEDNPDQDKCRAVQPPMECPIDDLSAQAREDGSILVTGTASKEFDLYKQTGTGDAELVGSFNGSFEFHDTETEAGTTYTYYAFFGPASCVNVEVTAIPVFPTALASVAALGVGALAYAGLRRRR